MTLLLRRAGARRSAGPDMEQSTQTAGHLWWLTGLGPPAVFTARWRAAFGTRNERSTSFDPTKFEMRTGC
jgi:hypothetical protein